MTVESATATETTIDPGPPIPTLIQDSAKDETIAADVSDDAPSPKPTKAEKRAERERAPAPPVSKDMQAINLSEDASLRSMLEQLGNTGAFKIAVARIEPEEFVDPSTNRRVKTSGNLKTYHEAIDEEVIAKKHGGGKYTLRISKASGKGDQMTFFKQRTIEIAGDPKLDDPALQRALAPVVPTSSAPAAPAVSEDSKVTVAALAMAERAMEKASTPQAADTTAYKLMIETMQRQIDAQNAEMRELRRALEDRNAQPSNPVENKLLTKLIDDDNARITAIRAQHESEVRMIKDQHAADIKRLEDRHDRAMESQRQSFEREISTMKSTQEIIKATTELAGNTSKEVLQGQVKSLERENAQLREELKDLRNKKDKSTTELIKEYKDLKEMFDDGDDDESEGGTIEKITEALPGTISAIGGLIGRGQAQQPQQQQVQQPQQQQKPQIIRDAQGQPYVLHGNQLVPVKRKRAQPAAPGEVQIPELPPEQIQTIVSMLELAYNGGQEPEVVAQTAGTRLAGQEDLLQAVRQLGGVDAFLSKVANLPSTSPLLTQGGKNWVRKFSKALLGE